MTEAKLKKKKKKKKNLIAQLNFLPCCPAKFPSRVSAY